MYKPLLLKISSKVIENAVPNIGTVFFYYNRTSGSGFLSHIRIEICWFFKEKSELYDPLRE